MAETICRRSREEALADEMHLLKKSMTCDDNDITTNDKFPTTKKKRGNGFVRAIGAPFRALGRLFGGGRKKNESRHAASTTRKWRSLKATKLFGSKMQPHPQQLDSEKPSYDSNIYCDL